MNHETKDFGETYRKSGEMLIKDTAGYHQDNITRIFAPTKLIILEQKLNIVK